ncbi:sulfatase [Bacteroidia bacterium]|nr:sulfatase [Bacteroidia bacterium]
MKRSLVLSALGGFACVGASAAGSTAKPAGAPAAAPRPNILIILSDDMGYSDIGCYGGIIQTPNLDRLAANGLQYMQFYNTARSCPSRASLLTGLHPHQAGMGHMTDNRGEDGYLGGLNNHCVTMAEVLRPAGYATYAVGKWHVSRDMAANGPKFNWPLQRGFDHFYGTIQGGGSYYDPQSLCRGNTFVTVENDPEYHPESFYYTDAIADNAITFLRQRRGEQKPFFMYLAFTSAHWPMHLPQKEIDAYRGKFDQGWDALREAKYSDMVRRGIIRREWALSDDPSVGKWADVSNKAFEARCMEVYAGMITNLDRNIGRVVEQLRSEGTLDNTIILFLQDNGGCAEPMQREREPFKVRIPKGEKLHEMGRDELQTRLIPYQTRDGRPVWQGQVMPGGPDTYVAYGRSWAHLSNTPFREYKHWIHEGGISTPLIVHWPKGIKDRGQMRQRPGQLTDVMATCIELSGASYPKTVADNEIYPCQSKSLVASFAKDDPGDTRTLYWEHEGNRAIRSGKWKLVYKARDDQAEDIPLDLWELYDMETDRTETRNLASKYPKLVADMAAKWDEFAVRCHVKPWPRKM